MIKSKLLFHYQL